MWKMKKMEQTQATPVWPLYKRMNELEERAMEYEKDQNMINVSVCEVFEMGDAELTELNSKIRFLRKVTIGLIFVTAGFAVSLLKTNTQILELRKTMNEG